MSYQTPQAFRAALTRKAKVAARGGTRTVQELLEQFYLARLLARVFLHDPTGWVLKGGQALLMRYPDARHSRDVDLVRDSSAEALAALFIEPLLSRQPSGTWNPTRRTWSS